ncbi:hypothetical protein BC941DRAFT_438240 [Chlamydoabsidia padenii]|nr:hypothetical protein BC941DRAFT_438240 [Chlamydoabsidia padenii]
MLCPPTTKNEVPFFLHKCYGLYTTTVELNNMVDIYIYICVCVKKVQYRDRQSIFKKKSI